jgi:DUF1680 family protein
MCFLVAVVTTDASVPTTTSALIPIPLDNVTLLAGSYQFESEKTNLEYLNMLSMDSFLYDFRATCGIDPSSISPDKPYGGWIANNTEHRGSFTGHYLSASAMAWASTKNGALRTKMEYLVQELRKCQVKNEGYVMAFPSSIFDSLEYNTSFYNKTHWHPYYNMHKVFAGLIDQYTFAKNVLALAAATDLGNYLFSRIQKFNATVGPRTSARWQQILDAEWGGMNEAAYNLFAITHDRRYSELGDWFAKEKFTQPLLNGVDPLTGLHANTHIPTVVGAARRYEVGGGEKWRQMSEFFFETLNTTRDYATGGSNYKEHWHAPRSQGELLLRENQETCSQYNMLKVRHAQRLLSRHAQRPLSRHAQRPLSRHAQRLLSTCRAKAQA